MAAADALAMTEWYKAGGTWQGLKRGFVLCLVSGLGTVFASGLVCLAGSIWFAYKLPAIRAVVRPIYRERGIITVPAVDTGAKTL